MNQADRLKQVKVLDCTVRDGGHLNHWTFPLDFVQRYVKALEHTGVDLVEIGYRSTPNSVKRAGQWRYSTDDLIRSAVGISKANIGVCVDIGKIKAEDFAPKKDSPISIVRVAFYKSGLDEAIALGKALFEKGYETTFSMMASSDYLRGELERAVTKLDKTDAQVIYFADSFGSFRPEQVSHTVALLRRRTRKLIGFHPHNNQKLALENTFAAITSGAQYVDATLGGIGRGAGNLRLEHLLPILDSPKPQRKPQKYNVQPATHFIETDIAAIMKQTPWGTNDFYRASGELGIHPTYASELQEAGFTPEQARAVMEIIATTPHDSSFDKDLLARSIQKFKKPTS